MGKLKYFIVKNKVMIIIISIILVCAIAIAIGVFAQVTNRKVIVHNDNTNQKVYNDFETKFNDIFTNEIKIQNSANKDLNYDDIIYTAYDINEEKPNYNIQAKIPLFKLENETTNSINKEIYDVFISTIINIAKTATVPTTFNLDYVVYINNNTLSLVIRCIYKDGNNPQRNIIKAYNYNLENNKIITISEMLEYKGLNKEEVQKSINEKIKEKNKQMKSISEQGYNVFTRNEEDNMYKVENTTNFFLGQDDYLYLVYAYGNNNFTSEMDLVIF